MLAHRMFTPDSGLNLMENVLVVYFFSPCQDDQTTHGLENEHKAEGVLV